MISLARPCPGPSLVYYLLCSLLRGLLRGLLCSLLCGLLYSLYSLNGKLLSNKVYKDSPLPS
jgi:hypothetical protein